MDPPVETESRGGSLSKFDPKVSSFAVFSEIIKQFLIANNITDGGQKTAILLSTLSTEYYVLLRNLCAPNLPDDISYDQLASILSKHFPTVQTLFSERLKFYTSKRQQNEPVSDWEARVKALASNCGFGAESTTVMRDIFVLGIRDKKIMDRLLEEDASKVSFENVVKTALSMESALREQNVRESEIIKDASKGGVNQSATFGSTRMRQGAHIWLGDDKIVIRILGQIIVIDKPQDDAEGVQVFVKVQDRFIRKIKIDQERRIVNEVLILVKDELPENLLELEHTKETMASSEEHTDILGGSECSNIQSDKSQMDCLLIIFKKHEGFIDEDGLNDLFQDIILAVHNKECHPVLIDVLKGLEGHFHTSVHDLLHSHLNQPMTSLLKDTAYGDTKVFNTLLGHDAGRDVTEIDAGPKPTPAFGSCML